MIAAQQGNEEIVKKLLEFKPNTNQTDKFGKRASDRAATQSICYIIQSAGIDQRLGKSKGFSDYSGNLKTSKGFSDSRGDIKISPKSTIYSQRGESGGFKGILKEEIRKKNQVMPKSTSKRRLHSPPKAAQKFGSRSEEHTSILTYYREKFMEQIALLTKKLSQKASQQLENVMQEELDRSESFLRGVVGSELGLLTDKMRSQIDQHIVLKTKLAAAKAGAAEAVEGEAAIKLSSELKTKFPLAPKNKEYSMVRAKAYEGVQKQVAKKTITRLNRTIDSLIDSKEDILQNVKSNALSPKNFTREKQELYAKLKREVMIFVGEKIDEIAQSIAAENRSAIVGILRDRLNFMEKELRTDVKTTANNFGKELKARVDTMVTEKLTRIAKQVKTARNEEYKNAYSERVEISGVEDQRGAEHRANLPPKNTKFSQLSELQSSIRGLDNSYNAMLDSCRGALKVDSSRRIKEKPKPPKSEKKGRNTTERMRSLSNRSKDSAVINRPDVTPYYVQLSNSRSDAEKVHEQSVSKNEISENLGMPRKPKYYMSIQQLAGEGQATKVNYALVQAHNSKVIPSSKLSSPGPDPKDIEEDRFDAKSQGPNAKDLRVYSPKYIGDSEPKRNSPPTDDKLNSLLARYSNVYQKGASEEQKGKYVPVVY